MKIKDFLNALKIAALVGKSLTTGKVAKTLDTIEKAAPIADAVRELVKDNKKK